MKEAIQEFSGLRNTYTPAWSAGGAVVGVGASEVAYHKYNIHPLATAGVGILSLLGAYFARNKSKDVASGLFGLGVGIVADSAYNLWQMYFA